MYLSYNTTISIKPISNATSEVLNQIKKQTIMQVILKASLNNLDDDGTLQIQFSDQITVPSSLTMD